MTDHTAISQVSRLEVISTGARRRWTLAEKQRIVAESYSAPRVVSATARRNGLSASQLFTWRRLARAGRLIEAEEAATFAPAIISREASTRTLSCRCCGPDRDRVGVGASCGGRQWRRFSCASACSGGAGAPMIPL